MQKIYIFLAATLIGVSMFSCSLDDLPDIEGDFLGPIVNGKATIEDLSDLNDKTFTQEIEPEHVNPSFIPGVTLPLIPPFTRDTVGPYPAEVSEYFRVVTVDSGVLDIEFTNVFPFPISAGTQIVFRNDSVASPSSHIYTHEIITEIEPGARYDFQTIFRNSSINSTIYLFIEPLKSRGIINPSFVRGEGDDQLNLNFTLRFLDVSRIEIRTEKAIIVQDTTGIDIFEDNTPEATGTLTAFIVSSLPVNAKFQLFILDENYVLLDSLFNQGIQIIPGGTTNTNGDPVQTTEITLPVEFSPERVARFKAAKKSWVYFDLDTKGYPGEVVVCNNKTFFQVKLVGDLNVKFDIGGLFGN